VGQRGVDLRGRRPGAAGEQRDDGREEAADEEDGDDRSDAVFDGDAAERASPPLDPLTGALQPALDRVDGRPS
jgi:hypothetical protein